ncbi:MAG TPA: hypothetical protein VGR89_03195, partial [Puia sp.]|nr:hypothetical protein [Puia sp.]
MKKLTFFLLPLVLAMSVHGQDPAKAAVETQINDSIRTNGVRQITAQTVNAVMHAINLLGMDTTQVLNAIAAQAGRSIPNLVSGQVPLGQLPSFLDTLYISNDTVNYTIHHLPYFFVIPSLGGGMPAADTLNLSHRADTLGVDVDNAELGIIDTAGALRTALAGKEPVITAPNAADKYWNGFKQFATLNTDSVTEGSTNKYFHPSDTSGLDEAATQITLLDTAAAIRNSKVDTIYRTPGVDSIKFTINGRQHEILDSIGGPGGGSDSGFSLAYVSLAGQPLAKLVPGGTSKRIIEIDTTLADPNSMVQEYQLTNAINAINNTVSNRHDDAAADTLLTWDLFGNTQARQIQDTSTDGSVTITKT